MTDQTIQLYLVDDQAMIRASMRSLLDKEEGFSVIGDNGDAREAINEVARLRPDVILLDITMPGLSGIDAIAMLRKAHQRVKVVMLTHHEGESFVQQALDAGADGYLSKDSDPQELGVALRAVVQGNPFISPKVARGLVATSRTGARPGQPTGLRSLTTREREVFQLLALGKSNKEVAHELDMSLGTAKKHRENLQRKLDCHSAAELARLAIREGLLGT
jgi:DNA-binding NarL/FixJ family response regulator